MVRFKAIGKRSIAVATGTAVQVSDTTKAAICTIVGKHIFYHLLV